MEELVKDCIWINSAPLKYYGLNIGTKMTIVKLNDSNLFLHSPTKLTKELKNELDKIGKVRFLIAPNKLHHLHIKDYADIYNESKAFGVKELKEKRKDIDFAGFLDTKPQLEWEKEIDQTVFEGSVFSNEVIFFHKDSKTLIVTDLLEQYDKNGHFKGLKEKIAAKFLGIYKTPALPIDEKLFILNKKLAKKAIEKILTWDFNKIIMAHGPLVKDNAKDVFYNAFRWLL